MYPYRTQPVPAPKPPFPSRQHALEMGELIEVGDLECSVPGLRTRALGCALSERLIDRVEDLPFDEIGRSSAKGRLRHLLLRAGAAFDRALAHYGDRAMGAMMHGFVVDFAVRLPCRATHSPVGFARLHCGLDADGEIAVTLGECEEI